MTQNEMEQLEVLGDIQAERELEDQLIDEEDEDIDGQDEEEESDEEEI